MINAISVPPAGLVRVTFNSTHPVYVPLLNETNVGDPTKAAKINSEDVTLFRSTCWERRTMVTHATLREKRRAPAVHGVITAHTTFVETPRHERGAPRIAFMKSDALLILLNALAVVAICKFPRPDLAQKYLFETIAGIHRKTQMCRQSKTKPKKCTAKSIITQAIRNHDGAFEKSDSKLSESMY